MGRKEVIIICVVALAVSAGAILIWPFVAMLISGHYVLDRFRIDDMTVTVEGATSWEVSEGICIRASDRTYQVPRTFIGSTHASGKLRFALIRPSEQSRVVALIETHSPDIVYAVIDFEADRCWPRELPRDEAKALLKLLPSPDGPLRLSDEVPGNEDTLLN